MPATDLIKRNTGDPRGWERLTPWMAKLPGTPVKQTLCKHSKGKVIFLLLSYQVITSLWWINNMNVPLISVFYILIGDAVVLGYRSSLEYPLNQIVHNEIPTKVSAIWWVSYFAWFSKNQDPMCKNANSMVHWRRTVCFAKDENLFHHWSWNW